MVPELEKPRVTEIHVRMDCNGCVQKIKKALQGINGIYDLYIDFPTQKLTVVGWADPEKIIKAIKKTRKIATICSDTEPSDPSPSQPSEPSPEGGSPASNAPNPTPTEPPLAEATQPENPPKDPPPPTPENPAPEMTPPPENPTPVATAASSKQPETEKIHIIHHHPSDYSYSHGHGGHQSNYHNGQGRQPELPMYVTHSYNTYKPSRYISEYAHFRSPPRHAFYSQPEHYSEDYHHRNNSNSDGNNITSMFSDENPNACTIV